ncbi:MAG: alpha/beta hydrolase [Candidatus Odinarchaeota archaeon]
MSQEKEAAFPVGYHNFTPSPHLNFELNRWFTMGYARYEDMKAIGARIKDFDQWRKELRALAEQALSENQLLYAAFYYRAVEFFTFSTDPEKEKLYDLFIQYFNQYYGTDKIERHQIPYDRTYLPCIRINHEGAGKGTVVIHGGFDSFIEEFYPVMKAFVRKTGYEVVLFDGPGQGGALHKCGLKLINEWEKPVGAVLDYFNLENVTLIGVSLGGYLAVRAAAFEPRIARVVCFDAYYDFKGQLLGRAKPVQKLVINFLLKANLAGRYNRILEKARQRNLQTAWAFDHMNYVTGKATPFESTKYMLSFSAKKISSRVTQDVLVLAGKQDHLVPIKMFWEQKKALSNARSVTGRIFTEAEHASAHCQVGNIQLVLDYIAEWINTRMLDIPA